MNAIMRFVYGLLAVLVMLPITYGANTPDFVNNWMLSLTRPTAPTVAT